MNVMKKYLYVISALLLLTACVSNQADNNVAYEIHRFDNNPYLAEVWWGDDYDPDATIEYLKQKYNQPAEAGGCSSWHKGDYHGRNIDWSMRDFATLIIHMPRTDKVKYASVGLLAGNPAMNKALLDSVKIIPEELRNILAASVVDGINEKGVCINHNIVPYDGRSYEKEGDIVSVMVCRYVLDNCATAKEAVDLLRNTKVTQSVVALAHDYSHFFISDPTTSYVVEWIDKEMVATEFKNDGKGNFYSEKGHMPAIMTNYLVAVAEEYGLKSNDFFKHHNNGAGVERAETIAQMLDSANSVNDHLDICRATMYRQFCQGKTQWVTENAGFYGFSEEKGKAYWTTPDGKEMHWMDNDNVYEAAKQLFDSPTMTNYYKDFNDKWDKVDASNNYWFTQHSVVYDLKKLKCYIIMQEGIFSNDVIEISLQEEK